ncbi:MAG: recombinase family protein [Hungatella sp.]|jgi:DNA invertase Pin-like site-specific DNA recombinase|nr:recombinase family protein [Hungatella sp.]
MARTSRNRTVTVTDIPELQVYSTGAYVRLSVLDGNKTDSDSIENQEAMLLQFIENDPSLSLYSVYVDNGETGVNFERDSFERLLDDIRSGKVDCVIVKDLSRFGRNYIEAGEYLEKIFPYLGIRFIAVNDGYDSLDPATCDSLSMHLKNLVNDVYARDISGKITPVLREKQEQGEFIGTWAAYGYLKSEEDKHRLVVDDDTAPIVRDIFRWRLQGLSYQTICNRLTNQEVPSPSQYRYAKGLVRNQRWADAAWRIGTIKGILCNEVYLGHMVQGRKHESLFHGQKQTFLPKEQWIIVRDTHEPIIDQQTFDAVQRLNQRKVEQYTEKLKRFSEVVNTENILKGVVCCGDCGTNLVRYKNVRENKRKKPRFHVWYTYICPVHNTDLSRCSFLSIPERDLLEVVYGVIQTQILAAIEMEKLIKSMGQHTIAKTKRQQIQQRIQQTKDELVRIYRMRESLYDDYLGQLMSEKDYLYAQNRYKTREAELNALLGELTAQERKIRETSTDETPWLQAFLTFRDEPQITRKMVLELVDKVIVHSRTAVTVQLRFQDEYELLVQELIPESEGGCQ